MFQRKYSKSIFSERLRNRRLGKGLRLCGLLLTVSFLSCIWNPSDAFAARLQEQKQQGSITLTPDQIRDQIIINLECEGLADQHVLLQQELDLRTKQAVYFLEAAKSFQAQAIELNKALEAEKSKSEALVSQVKQERAKGKKRAIKWGAIIGGAALVAGLILGGK